MNVWLNICVVVLFFGQSFGQCPDLFGRFALQGQCDSYLECLNGIPFQKSCPQGLLFKGLSDFSYPCAYPAEVDCTGREATQPPNPSQECPNSFGLYRIGGPTSCGQYMNCVHGKAFIQNCPEGLAFSDEKLQCEWPDLVPSCNAEEYLGFSCPSSSGSFRDPYGSCERFFTCNEGRPRLSKCGKGKGFNQETETCEDKALLGC